MNRLSVIIAVYNGEKYLEKTLESLITQTTEDFEVIIVDDGSTDKTAEIAQSYCDEYNGFYLFKCEHRGVYAARNTGIEKAKGDFLMFLDCGDLITDSSVEAVFKCADDNNADIITGRCWRNGDIEYEYEKSLDLIATMPEIDMLESRLLYSETIGAKAFARKFFEHYNIRFLDLTAHGELLFIMQCVFCNVKISGCSEFILEKSVKPIEDGFSKFELPTLENVKSAKYVFSEIFDMGRDKITEQTGSCDGDEAYIQEIIYMIYRFYLDTFYRKYWYMSAQTINEMKLEFEKYAQLVKPERFKKLAEANSDLRLPYIYTDKKEAVGEAEFTFLFDLTDPADFKPMLRSIYAQTYPFFEIIVSESRFSLPEFPEEFRKMENLRVFPDKNFHSRARNEANSKICIELRDGKPLDMRTLQQTVTSKSPAFMKQFVFTQIRKSLNAKKTLKDKGLNFNS